MLLFINNLDGSISTHTLTWSVTNSMRFVPFGVTISTHTLTWSVTCCKTSSLLIDINFNSHAHVERDNPCALLDSHRVHFNSHAHVERDENEHIYLKDVIQISTHTLTWSVTKW